MLYKTLNYIIDLTRIVAVRGIYIWEYEDGESYEFIVFVDNSNYIRAYSNNKELVEDEFVKLLQAWFNVKGEKSYNFSEDELKKVIYI